MLMEAMRRTPQRTLVIIGRNHEPLYGAIFQMCRTANTIVLPPLPEEELAGAYAAARVVAQPSWDEVVSLSTLNAAACEAALALTRNSYEHEYIRDDAFYCDPGSVESIARAIDLAWNTYESRAERRAQLAARVRRDYTWDEAAKAVERAVRRAMEYNPRGAVRLRDRRQAGSRT